MWVELISPSLHKFLLLQRTQRHGMPANCSTFVKLHGSGDRNHNVPQDSSREHLKVAPDTKEFSEAHIIKLMTNVAKLFLPTTSLTQVNRNKNKESREKVFAPLQGVNDDDFTAI